MRREHQGVAIAVLTSAIWGATFPVMKLALNDASPLAFMTLRFLLASALLILIVRRLTYCRKGVMLGVLVFLGFYLQLLGLKFTTATKSAFITGMSVVFVPLIDYLVFGRRPRPKVLLAAFLGITGLALLTEVTYSPVNLGDVLTLGSAVAWAGQIMAVDRLVGRLSPRSVALYQSIPPFLLSAAFSLLGSDFTLRPTLGLAVALIYTGGIATALGLSLQAVAQEMISPEAAALSYLSEPIFAALFASLMLGEAMNLTQATGALLIITSMLMGAEKKVNEFQEVK